MDLQRTRPPAPFDHQPPRPDFTLTSPDLVDGEQIPMAHVYSGAGGGNTSPHLSWSGFPADTKGFAVTVFDPDAPSPSGWWHWLLFGLAADCTKLPAGAGSSGSAALPEGAVMLRNDFDSSNYDGPAPPPGDHHHRYYFTVHALDTDDLGLTGDEPATVGGFQLAAHTLARAHLMVTYAH
ncbi:MAG: YbhB/YbcL family Raf kinase inhibitor-like protein [Candidatus Nanopelagicales bacterium]